MSPLERLLAEEWPDGTFGGPRPSDPAPAPSRDAEAAQHYADLAAAVYHTHRTRKATT